MNTFYDTLTAKLYAQVCTERRQLLAEHTVQNYGEDATVLYYDGITDRISLIHHGLGENYHVTDKEEYEEIHAELLDSVGDWCHDCFHELPF